MPVDEVCGAILPENVEGKKVKDLILPRFILAGTTKCGTTVIQHAICKHPQVVPLLRIGGSTQFFNFAWNEDLPANVQVIAFIFLPETF